MEAEMIYLALHAVLSLLFILYLERKFKKVNNKIERLAILEFRIYNQILSVIKARDKRQSLKESEQKIKMAKEIVKANLYKEKK